MGAGGDVGQDERSLGAIVLAGANGEILVAGRIEEGKFETLDDGLSRLFPLKTDEELPQGGACALDLDEDALRRI